MSAPRPLTDAERATLVAICDAFHPRLTAESGDDEILFALSASDVGVPAAAESAITRLPAAQRGELELLLWLLDSGFACLLLAGIPSGVTRMSGEQRVRLLNALATSGIPQLRTGFQAFKRLSSFVYYSVTDERGESRVWPRIRYEPSSLPPPRAERLSLTPVNADTTIDADVCVVGSGAGGGVVAAELASRGLSVVVLEAGPGDQAGDFDQRELRGMERLYLDSGLTATRDLGMAILAGACLGGGTAVNWQTSLRTPDRIRDEWTERSGCALFTSDQFTDALDAVAMRLGVSTRESVVNANNAPIERGCATLGYSWSPIARNSVGCDPSQCGYCTFGCRLGGKQSTTVTYLRDAQRDERTRIVTDCRAHRVTSANGHATGVIAIARDGDREYRVTVRAPRVVVAAGGIESPALLQRSGLSLPELGRNLFLHPTTAVAGFYDDVVEAWSGPPQSILCGQFASLDGNYGFRLETAPAHPGLLALALPWTDPRQHRRLMQRCAHASAMIVLTRDAVGGRVRTRSDGTAMIDYVPGPAERRLIARGIAEAARVHLAAGAREVRTLHASGPALRRADATTQRDIETFCTRLLGESVHRNRAGLFSAHQMGTCRMGRDAGSAVCDERGEVFGVRGLYIADSSAFPASSGVNPMITVMALAQCVAEGIE